ncbi:hypothetical protein [Propioniciclava coleopterorum]|uniref:hypothetical protein n=1 Tax=Propioniciclava coleopterorum TaxID=2714937 RepID=UPI00197F120C|nr:hypothetical protein [Propioniciclava coleopterorum]
MRLDVCQPDHRAHDRHRNLAPDPDARARRLEPGGDGLEAATLDGLAAIMESHFRYEERELLGILATLDLDADPRGARPL